jgi:predicted ribosome quality control (RQC) complex YloA/Tae2 family protein
LSLNWREIDAILRELPLQNSLIREVHQPSYPQLVFELYRPGGPFRLLFSFANPYCRLHRLSRPRQLPKPAKPQRFVTFLRAHVRGGRILSAGQVGRERIVRLEVNIANRTVLLWARLWASAPNMVATDPAGIILDALYRRPGRGEVSGGSYDPGLDIARAGPGNPQSKGRYEVRNLPGSGSFNERVESYYFALEEAREAGALRASLLGRLRKEENRLLASMESLQKKRNQYREFEKFKKWGDLILSNLHTIAPAARWLTAVDIDDPGITWDIELDPRTTAAQNAESYYNRYRKAKAGYGILEKELQQQERHLARVRERIRAAEAGGKEASVESLRQQLRGGSGRVGGKHPEQPPGRRPPDRRPPGLQFTSGPFTILVGRNARENDALLRRFVRGNDIWLHARDYPGGYVFVRSLRGKTVPLENLLDAANLALLYSRAKGSAQGDVFYTPVKYLKRAKGAETGMVIPTQEKNLHVKLDMGRIRRLRGPAAPVAETDSE